MPSSRINQQQPSSLMEEWPNEAIKNYEPIKELGKGCFASVVLAKRRRNIATNTNDNNEVIDYSLVAMKQVRAKTSTQKNYANRELYILRELDHPNIVKLIEYWEPKNKKSTVTMALSYVGNRTLKILLEKYGSPSLTFSRVVIAQLVDAVSYLHSHAVIHRDIKPDNIVLRGIDDFNDNTIFDDKDTIDLPWKELKKRWHLTLVDFGFARALGPKNIKSHDGLNKNLLEESSHHSNISINDALIGKKSTKKKHIKLNNLSHHKIIDLSALGCRNYAAPEVQYRVREHDPSFQNGVNSTLSKFVSNYGMTADAFSIGATARYLLTGVKPEDNVDEVIAYYNNPINKLIRKIKRKRMKKRNKLAAEKWRERKYRSASKLPPDGLKLIKAMTHLDLQNRMSVRDARSCPYVADVLEDHNFTKNIKFLDFVIDSKEKNVTRC